MQRSRFNIPDPHYGTPKAQLLREVKLPFPIFTKDLHGEYPYRYAIGMVIASVLWVAFVIGIIALMDTASFPINEDSRDPIIYGCVISGLLIYAAIMSRLSAKKKAAYSLSKLSHQEELAIKFADWLSENGIPGEETAALKLIRNGHLLVPDSNVWGASMIEFTPYGYKLKHQNVLIWN